MILESQSIEDFANEAVNADLDTNGQPISMDGSDDQYSAYLSTLSGRLRLIETLRDYPIENILIVMKADNPENVEKHPLYPIYLELKKKRKGGGKGSKALWFLGFALICFGFMTTCTVWMFDIAL